MVENLNSQKTFWDLCDAFLKLRTHKKCENVYYHWSFVSYDVIFFYKELQKLRLFEK